MHGRGEKDLSHSDAREAIRSDLDKRGEVVDAPPSLTMRTRRELRLENCTAVSSGGGTARH